MRAGNESVTMKKVLYGIAGLIAILIAAILIVPSVIDWNDYKAEIAAEVKKATGRDVTLNGDLSLAILPSPRLSIADAHLSNIPGAAARSMISLKELTVSVKFAPLLHGAIEVASVELVEPVIELEKLANGAVNWSFAPPAVAQSTAKSPPPALGAGLPPESPPSSGLPGAAKPATGSAAAKKGGSSAGSFRLDRVAIVRGKLIYRDATSGTVELIEGIDIEGSAQSAIGPFTAKGAFVVRGIPLSLQLSTGQFAEKGTVPISVTVKAPAAGASVALKGTVTDVETAPRVSVKLEGGGPDLGALIAAVSGGARATGPARPFSVKSSVEANETAVAVNGLTLTVAGTEATGSARVGLGPVPRIEASLKTPLIDLNRLMAPPAGRDRAAAPAAPPANRAGQDGSATTSSGTAVPAAPAAPKGAAPGIPRGIEASVSLSAAEIAWKDGRARDAALVANLKDGVLSLDTLSVHMPGSAELSVTARASGEQALSYSGRFKFAAANLRATLDWVDATVAGVAADRLRRLSVSGGFSGNADQLQIASIDAQIDTTRIAGGVTVALRDRPAFGASVSIDQINIDSYLPPKPAAASGKDAPAATTGSGSAEKSATGGPAAGANRPPAANAAKDGPFAALAGFDANLVLRAGRLVYQQSEIRDIAFDGTLQNGSLTIRDASVQNFAGTSAQVKGTLAGLAGIPSFNGSVAAASNDLSGLFRVAGIEPPVPAKTLGAMRLATKTEAAGERLSVDATLQLGDIRAAVKGTGTGLAGTPAFDMGVDIAHPDFRQFVRLFDPGFTPRNPQLGDFRLATRLTGNPADLKLEAIKGNIGKTTLSGTGSVRMASPRPVVDLDLKSGAITVSDFLRAPQRAQSESASQRAGASPPGDGTPRLIRVSSHDGASAARPASSARWSRETINTAALALVDATIDLGAEALLYDSLRVDQPKVVANLKDQVLDISHVSGKMFDGGFEMKGRLDARAVPSLSTTVTVTKANVNKLLFEAAAFDIASGILDFRLDLAATGASQFDMIRTLGGNGRIDVANGVVRGFDLRGVSDALKRAGRIEGLFGIIGSAMGGGSTKFDKLDGSFKIDKGVVRTDDLKLAADAGAGNAIGFVDLPAWNIDMNASFRLTEHPKAPVLKVRASGPPDDPKRTFDLNELQAWALGQGVGGLLKSPVPGLPGSGKEEAPATGGTQQQNQPQPANPADLLKGLLKGLGR